MGIPFARMDKIFLTHLHGDHMSDLTHIYCFGPSTDRKSPLYIWGPGNSGVKDPDNTAILYQDGTKEFCRNFRNMCRWHTESFSFGVTRYGNNSHLPKDADWGLPSGTLTPVVPDGMPDVDFDGYAIVPIELDWTKYGQVQGDNIAYHNAATGVKITHFPAVHCRQGSISYKLEWNGLSMIFSGDTKPNQYMIDNASGVTVLIHEMVVPAEIWAMKNLGYTDLNQAKTDASWTAAYNYALAVQNSSHTPQGALGYILSKIKPAPTLTVATHFQAADDTIASALSSIRNHYSGNVTIASDLMVLNVTASTTRVRRAVVSDFSWYPRATLYPNPVSPKYHNPDGTSNPTAQLDPTAPVIPPTNPDGTVNYLETGY
jgi:ribonuclease Z